jgi:hypothetical protein
VVLRCGCGHFAEGRRSCRLQQCWLLPQPHQIRLNCLPAACRRFLLGCQLWASKFTPTSKCGRRPTLHHGRVWVLPALRHTSSDSAHVSSGVIATKALAVNTTILSVPVKMILTGTAALSTARETPTNPVAPGVRSTTASGIAFTIFRNCEDPRFGLDRAGMEEALVIAFLLSLRDSPATNEADPDVARWKPAIDVLPQEFDSMPAVLDADTRDTLFGGASMPLLTAIDEQIEHLNVLWDALTSCVPQYFGDAPASSSKSSRAKSQPKRWNRNDFHWAFFVVFTRRFAFYPGFWPSCFELRFCYSHSDVCVLSRWSGAVRRSAQSQPESERAFRL